MPMQINEMIDITPEEMVAIGAAASAAAAVMWMMKNQWIEKTADKAMEIAEKEAERLFTLRLERGAQAVDVYKEHVDLDTSFLEAGSQAWADYLAALTSVFNTSMTTSAGIAPIADKVAMMAIPSGGGTQLLKA